MRLGVVGTQASAAIETAGLSLGLCQGGRPRIARPRPGIIDRPFTVVGLCLVPLPDDLARPRPPTRPSDRPLFRLVATKAYPSKRPTAFSPASLYQRPSACIIRVTGLPLTSPSGTTTSRPSTAIARPKQIITSSGRPQRTTSLTAVPYTAKTGSGLPLRPLRPPRRTVSTTMPRVITTRPRRELMVLLPLDVSARPWK